MADLFNSMCITRTAPTVLTAMGIQPDATMDKPNELILSRMNRAFGGEKADRALLFNPDAVALWLYQKYTHLFEKAVEASDMAIPLYSVMPSVTPVCFASMYSGVQPCVHGIMKYEKPVLKVKTLFDCLLEAGKKVAICCTDGDSISRIFLEREIDYFFYKTVDEVNAKATELVENGEHDVIVVYNGNFDYTMHKNGPEAEISLEQIRKNSETYLKYVKLVSEKWADHNVFYGFMPDHGCHEIDGDCGSHGLEVPEDMNVIHFYGFKKRNA